MRNAPVINPNQYHFVLLLNSLISLSKTIGYDHVENEILSSREKKLKWKGKNSFPIIVFPINFSSVNNFFINLKDIWKWLFSQRQSETFFLRKAARISQFPADGKRDFCFNLSKQIYIVQNKRLVVLVLFLVFVYWWSYKTDTYEFYRMAIPVGIYNIYYCI